nr:N-acetylmuramoyl-L-alanine amidase [Clostridia bacterium]
MTRSLSSTRRALKLTAAVVVFSLVMALAAYLLHWLMYYGRQDDTAESSSRPSYPIVIIDAGHGGEDGGTSSRSGILEKDVNLGIALELAELMRIGGFEVVLTREDDRLLYGDAAKGKHKTQDLRTRYETAKKYPESVFVSIHANSFPDPGCGGLQVYYSPNDSRSGELASLIQTATAEYLQPENDRTTKKADSKIYLLDRITTPAVLVECGFLSNTAEAELLATEEYREKLAAVMYKALCDYMVRYEVPDEIDAA